MVYPISRLGLLALEFVQQLGRMAVFTVNILHALVRPPIRFRSWMREMYKLGVLSLIIICVSGIVVGMVLGLQGYHTLARFGAERSLGAMVGLSLIRELGPVLAALLLAGRAGSAATAEIGAMVATQQIDGLRMQSIDPIHFVIMPRALALTISTPLLTALFVVSGIGGAFLADVGILGSDSGSFISSLHDNVTFEGDIMGCMLKAVVFGFLLSVISTYRGYTSQRTAEGVSSATTSTVVIGSVVVLMMDYVITALWGI